MAEGKQGETLIAFESGHYKKAPAFWKGDSVWAHFIKPDGGGIHVNKDKVEYIESFGGGNTEPRATEKTTMELLGEAKAQAEVDLLKAEARRILVGQVGPEMNEFNEFKEHVTRFFQGVDSRFFTIEQTLKKGERL